MGSKGASPNTQTFRGENLSLHYAIWKARDGHSVIAGRFADDIVNTSKMFELILT